MLIKLNIQTRVPATESNHSIGHIILIRKKRQGGSLNNLKWPDKHHLPQGYFGHLSEDWLIINKMLNFKLHDYDRLIDSVEAAALRDREVFSTVAEIVVKIVKWWTTLKEIQRMDFRVVSTVMRFF